MQNAHHGRLFPLTRTLLARLWAPCPLVSKLDRQTREMPSRGKECLRSIRKQSRLFRESSFVHRSGRQDGKESTHQKEEQVYDSHRSLWSIGRSQTTCQEDENVWKCLGRLCTGIVFGKRKEAMTTSRESCRCHSRIIDTSVKSSST